MNILNISYSVPDVSRVPTHNSLYLSKAFACYYSTKILRLTNETPKPPRT